MTYPDAEQPREKLSRNFFMTDEDEAGIPWDNFVTALQVWSYMRNGVHLTVRQAADEFGVTDDVIREAVENHYWMSLGGPPDDPTKQYIDHDGE